MEYATKLDKIMSERGLSIYMLNKRLKEKGLPILDASAFYRYRKGKTGIGCTLKSNKKYPCILERICIALNVSSSEILEF